MKVVNNWNKLSGNLWNPHPWRHIQILTGQFPELPDLASLAISEDYTRRP